jgi:hypothetical protein
MTRQFLCVLFFASLVLPLPAAERRVVFAVKKVDFGPVPDDAKVYIEPIALADPMEAPPRGFSHPDEAQDEASIAFAQRYFDAGHRYSVLHGGTVRVLKRASAGCISLVATVESTGSLPALATNFSVPERTLRNREPSADELASLLAYGRRYFDARGGGNLELQIGDAQILDVDPATEPLLAGTIEVTDSRSLPECGARAILVVARLSDVTPRRLTPQFTIQAGCEDVGTPFIFGHLDLDRDGVDELIAVTYGKENHDYQLYRRGSDGVWKFVLRGGGAGC